jgi:hypothetical protein
MLREEGTTARAYHVADGLPIGLRTHRTSGPARGCDQGGLPEARCRKRVTCRSTASINLLSRFYDVDAGTITIDGQDIWAMQQAAIRKQLGIVLQDTFLFSSTVMENIRCGRLGAGNNQVYAAA